MTGGILKTTSIAALFAVAGVAAGAVSANAADFGGDCCADLEERVAELEATTARKGNRKVSLQIYGQVNTAVMFWEADGASGAPGSRSDVYVVDNDISSTRFGFKGKAKITPDYSAGFKIEIETQSADSNVVDGDANRDDNMTIGLRKAEWYLKSKTYGKLTVGQGGFANDGITHIDLSGTNVIAQFDDLKFGEKILAAPGIEYDDYTRGGPYEFNRGNRVRYDSPTFAGFIVSAAWGEDDAWDVALRYAGQLGDFKLAAGIAYGQSSDITSLSNDNTCALAGCDELEVLNGSASIIHNPTGLFVTFAAGYREFDNNADAVPGLVDETNTYYGGRAGISQRFIPLGKTAFYGEYQIMENDNYLGAAGVDTEAEIYGAGIVQKIDAAAMELYLGYRHVELGDNLGTVLDDLDVVTTGARIKF